MRAGLATREPGWLEFWDEIGIYKRSLQVNEGAESFVLHDGPPYANGDIHMGTAFNKVLKDLIVKYKTMRGFHAPYVPGWDCHGQPIEHRVEKDLGPEKMANTSQAELRALCREYALKYVDRQREQFKRLGVRGDWDDPYLTLKPEYEAGDVRMFAELYRKGMVYRGRKPIHWCYRCKTALAEAEIEYEDEVSHSIYVKFYLMSPPSLWADVTEPMSVLIWTTTPWTLPANSAVTLAGSADYVAVRVGGEVIVIADELVERVAEVAGWEDHQILDGKAKGEDLVSVTYRHPIHEGVIGRIVTGYHVDLSTGTGAVHTAPGHGDEDYLVGLEFDLPAPMPVDDDGVFDAGGGPFEGLHVNDANPKVIEFLREQGTLVYAGETDHSYPHCWRCKEPVIFRATEQWFISMDGTGLRDAALKEIDRVDWVPEWSVNRIRSMVGDRPDWCISRQRAWGVPIPVHHCAACGETVASDETFQVTEQLFATEGADAWFTKDPAEYLPQGLTCPSCGESRFVADKDIVDVWFESGVSHESVLTRREGHSRPCDLYLEGSDQHRGWFQSSLLVGVGAVGEAPFKSVLTHGFIVDGDGRKMSKSLGNVINPLDVIEKSGADIIRLWVAASDYSQDVSISDEILQRTSEAYRRMRNTFRFLLSNLYDYDPSKDVTLEDMPDIDRYALMRLAEIVGRVTKAYDDWKYHQVYHTIFGYCVTDLSAFYLDVLKDRLYSDASDSVSRRSAQTVLAKILTTLAQMLAPILSFTTEEVWQAMPASLKTIESVHLSGWPEIETPSDTHELGETFSTVLLARDATTKALEEARNSGTIKKSQEASARLVVPASAAKCLEAMGAEAVAEALCVSSVSLEVGEAAGPGGFRVFVESANGDKCPRCWNFRELGTDPEHPDVCMRCAQVLHSL